MDLRLSLLFICLCNQGVINAQVSKDESTPVVPLIPLLPSQPKEKNESTPQTDVASTTSPPLAMTTSAPEEDSEEEDEGCATIGRNPESREAIAASIQKLGVQLLQNLKTSPEKPNVIISPFSISLALSQLALGAVNETEELLMHHLHDNTLTCHHHALNHILAQLRNTDLKIATRIFLRQGFKPKEDFINESKRLYDSEPAVLESLKDVNDWVEDATNGKMTNFLSALPPNMLLMLINAVHFKGEWEARFDSRSTSKGAFYLDDKHMVEVDMMENAKHALSLLIDSELESQVAIFPFVKEMSFLVIMPMSGHVNVSSLAAKLNISSLYDRLPKQRVVQVKFPKFKLEYAQELQEVFTKLGLGQLFSNPNLADMADGPLMVSSVLHKSTMEINEEGAEAAAATTVVISRASQPVFHLNQPFLFALMDDKTKIPVFMGVINNPNPGAPIVQREESGIKEKAGLPSDKHEMSPPK
ncbi:serpin peptidase inhibitor, clade F (alpha-2 antiplasmin, pigment epithelium derived factor), member 2b [Dunckerocampus dactyliophorus]|uniref:serpin peptidase inhibitor, clade F (alpha-2 antiplasmin, pigment epithelium derived factor), member 2b n=1 Tax=Dunckerocampus dactyliophorus TaxID=161453 RepID=UPI002406CD59|nr:serpin peptidase inhibitor, clade F (alpha-2 antiplasmin, pigment epithelium derived factor), member 2b [Dunckerocampus dactyliophorus]XP_054650385.1 serpin peptidase inhibitor, clade F (alpha-2 antiplasmin, pigment epithelium derived factor), member 2b [Dunckerocampus dactyliophorus]XP_054650386.1 serpin peptidase inhibitor, clade F (alpha-2 antiplasmin, pigment epithelium derived factor), member 2b [Dunckerocampus dactyliophorus]